MGLSSDRVAPRYLLISGDLVDRSEDAEWDDARRLLTALKEVGTRIILSPGNHDLATAYRPGMAWRFLNSSSDDYRLVDSTRLMRYCDLAAELEPEIRCHDGVLLSQVIRDEYAARDDFQAAWQSAVGTAISEVEKRVPAISRRSTRNLGARSLRVFMRIDLTAARQLVDPLVDKAISFGAPAAYRDPAYRVSGQARQVWFDILSKGHDVTLRPGTLAQRWDRLWYALFPFGSTSNKTIWKTSSSTRRTPSPP